MRRTSCRTFSIAALALGALTGLSGCATPTGVQIDNKPYIAGPVRLAPLHDQWEVVFTAPTGGWQARFDTDRPMFSGREVFITLTSPDPDMFVTQSATDLHVLTPAPSDRDLDVYARVEPFRIKDASPPGLREWLFGAKDPNPPYHFATTSRPQQGAQP